MNTNLDPDKPSPFRVRWEPFRAELLERMYHTDKDFANVLHDTILFVEEIILVADNPHNPNVIQATAELNANLGDPNDIRVNGNGVISNGDNGGNYPGNNSEPPSESEGGDSQAPEASAGFSNDGEALSNDAGTGLVIDGNGSSGQVESQPPQAGQDAVTPPPNA